jgi:hypothetical protein
LGASAVETGICKSGIGNLVQRTGIPLPNRREPGNSEEVNQIACEMTGNDVTLSFAVELDGIDAPSVWRASNGRAPVAP